MVHLFITSTTFCMQLVIQVKLEYDNSRSETLVARFICVEQIVYLALRSLKQQLAILRDYIVSINEYRNATKNSKPSPATLLSTKWMEEVTYK